MSGMSSLPGVPPLPAGAAPSGISRTRSCSAPAAALAGATIRSARLAVARGTLGAGPVVGCPVAVAAGAVAAGAVAVGAVAAGAVAAGTPGTVELRRSFTPRTLAGGPLAPSGPVALTEPVLSAMLCRLMPSRSVVAGTALVPRSPVGAASSLAATDRVRAAVPGVSTVGSLALAGPVPIV
jgi:hypothetical protein